MEQKVTWWRELHPLTSHDDILHCVPSYDMVVYGGQGIGFVSAMLPH